MKVIFCPWQKFHWLKLKKHTNLSYFLINKWNNFNVSPKFAISMKCCVERQRNGKRWRVGLEEWNKGSKAIKEKTFKFQIYENTCVHTIHILYREREYLIYKRNIVLEEHGGAATAVEDDATPTTFRSEFAQRTRKRRYIYSKQGLWDFQTQPTFHNWLKITKKKTSMFCV